MLGTLLQWQASLPPWAADTWRHANGLLLLALIFLPLERRFALRPRPWLSPRWARDVAYYFLSSLLPGRVIALAVLALLWGLQAVAPGGLWPALGGLPAVPRFALALLVSELGFYWGHRWMHSSPRLWRLHAVHHSATELHWLANSRAHPLDLVLVRLCGLLPLYLSGLAQPARSEPDWLPLLVALVANGWGYLIHANLRWPMRWLQPFVATPAFHHWHHQHLPAGDHRHGNYAALLPVMDRLFGTWRAPGGAWPARYGIDEPPLPTLVDELLAPLMGAPPPPGPRR